MTCQWNLNSGFQSLAGFPIPKPGSGFRITLRYGTTSRENVRFVLLQNELTRAFPLTWTASMQIYWNKRNRSHKKRIKLPQDWDINMAAVTSCENTL